VAQAAPAAFFSYSREDSDFALKLAGDLKAAGASVWLDQLDILPGQRWDRSVEDALTNCPRMVVILSPASVSSTNVMDEVSFALEEQKTVIPVVYRDCTIPFRPRRVQHVDFRQDYPRGLQAMLKILAPGKSAGASTPAIPDDRSQGQPSVPHAEERRKAAQQTRLEEERKRATEQTRVEQERQGAAEQAQLEEERRKAAERTRLEEEREQAAEQARVEQEGKRAIEEARLEHERRKAAEQTRLEEERKHATEQARMEQEQRRAAEEARLEEEHRKAAEQTRLEEERKHASEQARMEQEQRRAAEEARLEEEHRKAAEQTRLEEERKHAAKQARVEQERRRAAEEARLKDERRESAEQAERTKREREQAEHAAQKKVPSAAPVGPFSASKFNTLRNASPTIRSTIGTGVIILIVAVAWLVFHRSDWNARNSGTHNWLFSIFGTSDGKRLWAVGDDGTILESDDGGEHWSARDSGTQCSLLRSSGPATASSFGPSAPRFWSRTTGANTGIRGPLAMVIRSSGPVTASGCGPLGGMARLGSRTTVVNTGIGAIAAFRTRFIRSSGPATASGCGPSAKRARFWKQRFHSRPLKPGYCVPAQVRCYYIRRAGPA
jgi:hypothetical protein